MKKLFLFLVLIFSILGCAKTKEQVAEKCLLQANQTFKNDWLEREKFFLFCMLENHYFWGETCEKYIKASGAERLSSFCYKYNQ